MNKKKIFLNSLNEHLKLGNIILNNDSYLSSFEKLCKIALKTYKKGKKIIFLGNGGSAADSQHLATELTVRYKINRKAIRAIALTTDTSALTAIGNDFSFEEIFSRQLEAVASKGDLVILISTSGNSKNILNAFKFCKKKKISNFSLLVNNGGKMSKLTKNKIIVPSYSTARIQEFHIFIGHNLCEYLELNL